MLGLRREDTFAGLLDDDDDGFVVDDELGLALDADLLLLLVVDFSVFLPLEVDLFVEDELSGILLLDLLEPVLDGSFSFSFSFSFSLIFSLSCFSERLAEELETACLLDDVASLLRDSFFDLDDLDADFDLSPRWLLVLRLRGVMDRGKRFIEAGGGDAILRKLRDRDLLRERAMNT